MPKKREAKSEPVTMRFDPELLKKIDDQAKRRGVLRTAWIMMAASRAVEEGL